MRQHSWRLLHFRNYPRSSLNVSNHHRHYHHFQVIRSCSLQTLKNPQFLSNPTIHTSPCYISRSFSAESVPEQPKIENPDHNLLVSDVLNKFTDVGVIEKELESNGVVVSNDVVLEVLKLLQSSPDGARRFFDFVSERHGEKLCSKGYNLMLRVFAENGLVDDFWGLVEIMKKKGYGISKVSRDKAVERFEKEGLSGDVKRLRGAFATGSVDNSSEKMGLRVSRMIRNCVWGEDVEWQIKDLNLVFDTNFVRIVVENLTMEPTKALIFFRWVDESGLCKHDESSYNAIARVLAREDCIDRFWKIVDELRSKGYDMEMETYDRALERFIKRKMIKDAVDLYEFAMSGANKPSAQCCTFLLKKIVTAKELDIGLFSRVVKIFTGNGNAFSDFMLNAVIKSLTSVGKFGECNKVLKEMNDGGYLASGNLQRQIAFGLSKSGMKDEASEFVDNVEASGSNLDYKAWASLIEGYCASGDLENASNCLQKMVLKDGVSNAGYAFEKLVSAYCRRNRATDAFKLLNHYVSEHQLKPWHATYKGLASKLLVQGGFEDALTLLQMMKNHGFPPYLDPFVEYVSKSGTADDAFAFMKAVTVKNFPSTSVVLRMFEAFFKARRHSEAQDFLSKCPRYIRRHADVLDLFCTMKPKKDPVPDSVAA